MDRRIGVRPRPRPAGSDQLPEPCRSCTYWEFARGQRGSDVSPDDAAPAQEKQEWWEEAALEWQPVGLVVPDHGGDGCAGFAVLGPPHRFPRAGRLGGTSPDALLLAMLWAREEDERVVDALVREALAAVTIAGARGLEAFATRRPGEPCHPPLRMLERAGFALHRNHGLHPLMRLDLRQTPGVRDRATEALRSLRGIVPRQREAPSLPTVDGGWSPRIDPGRP